MSVGLATFLTVRLDEDEEAARAAHYEGQRWIAEEEAVYRWPADEPVEIVFDRKADARFVTHYAPARALREVEAKRARLASLSEAVTEMDRQLADDDAKKIDQGVAIGRYQMALAAVKHDAAVYRDHPGYNEKMKP